MTHPEPKVRLEGEVQLRLVDAWEALNQALELAERPEFGRSKERSEWLRKVQAVRGCVLLAAARLIDVHHIEEVPFVTGGRRACLGRYTGHSFARRKARTDGEAAVVRLAEEVGEAARKFELVCPLGFPSMEFGLGRLAKWIEAKELQLVDFFGVGATPGRECAKLKKAKVEAKQAVRDALEQQDKMLEQAAAAMRKRAGV